jgi:ATP synthase I chain
MTPSRMTARITRETVAIVALLCAPAAWLGGGPGVVGVAAGGALGLMNLHALAGAAFAVSGRLSGRAVSGAWLAVSGLRFIVLLVACAALFTTGWAHPLGLLAGLTILPVAVLRHGLVTAAAPR